MQPLCNLVLESSLQALVHGCNDHCFLCNCREPVAHSSARMGIAKLGDDLKGVHRGYRGSIGVEWFRVFQN